jgi:Tol biopolymer transport system component
MNAGTKLGPYEILSGLGAGGMGEVYRARDTKLGRDVAIKVLPDAFARDSNRMARFGREAKLLASLNHSNIATIHGLEDSGNTRALVMELAEGPTLAERIAQGPIPIEDALQIAKQICEALEYAHEKGIIHRDLKPANVKVAPDDTVKILDFGLAKALETEPSAAELANSPTISRMATQAGVLLGTAAYMSPEQAKGKPVDRRADIWAFGCVLYEMLTGKMAFHGDTVTDTLAAVIKEEPDWPRLPAGTPMRVRVLLQRCLQKDPKQRLRDIGDARISLDEVLSGAPEAAPGLALPVSPWRRALPWAVAAAFGAAFAALAFVHFREVPSAPTELVRFQISLPESATVGATSGRTGGFGLSPDGRQLAYIASGSDGVPRLWVRALDSLDARPLDGTEGASFLPIWSPDSRYVAFESVQLGGTGAGGKLQKVAIAGGALQSICDVKGNVLGGSWNRDGVIIFGQDLVGVMRVSAGGGTPSPLAKLDVLAGAGQIPSFLPDGRHFLYYRTGPNAGTYIGSLDGGVQKPSSKPLVSGAAFYAPNPGAGPGHILFLQDARLLGTKGTLMAQRFDASRAELEGDPVPIAEGVSYFSVSSTGALAYAGGNPTPLQLTWFNRQGKVQGAAGGARLEDSVVLSPDGNRAFVFSSRATGGLWLRDFSRGTRSRFTFSSSPAGEDTGDAVWSRDGSRVIFVSSRDGAFTSLYEKPASGISDEVLLLKSSDVKHPHSWSPDGKFLFYDEFDAKTGRSSVWALPLDGDKKPRPFLQGKSNMGDAHVSPGGRFIAYASDESGISEVYVREFSPNSAGAGEGGKWQISTGGGTEVRWRGDGKELYYLTPDGKVMAVEITANPTFQAGPPKELFQGPPLRFTFGVSMPSQWGVTADGKRFIFPIRTAQTAPAAVSVMLNWPFLLKK